MDKKTEGRLISEIIKFKRDIVMEVYKFAKANNLDFEYVVDVVLKDIDKSAIRSMREYNALLASDKYREVMDKIFKSNAKRMRDLENGEF